MSDQDLARISATRLAAMIADRQVSPIELADHLLKRIEKLDSKLNAFSYFDPEHVREWTGQVGGAARGRIGSVARGSGGD